jgi:hypothetical protein
LAVNKAVFIPALGALISLDNFRLEVAALIRNEPLRRAEGSLAQIYRQAESTRKIH